jgi:hypothetical protein
VLTLTLSRMRISPSPSAKERSPLLVSSAMVVRIATNVAADDDDRTDLGNGAAERG